MPAAAPILGNIALNLAIGVGAAVVSSLLRPKPKKPKTTKATTSRGVTFEITDGEDVPVYSIVGRARTAGHLIYAQSYGTDNDFLQLVIVQGKGHYDALEAFIADEKVSTLSGSNSNARGYVVDNYRLNSDGEIDAGGTPYMWLKVYDGAEGQTADQELIDRAKPASRWGSAYTLTATPYCIVTMRYHPIFGSTIPNFGFVWRGLRMYDWRKDSTITGGSGSHRWTDQSTWEWSENPAVIAWNYRRGIFVNDVRIFGMGLSFFANDLSYFTAAANVADTEKYFEDTDETLATYAFGREVTMAEEPLDVMRDLEASWSGSSFDRGGSYAPIPAASVVSVMTLLDSDRLVGFPVTADKWGSLNAKKSSVAGQFVSSADGWVSKPYSTRSSSSLKTLIGGDRRLPLDQPWESTPERAQMRAQIVIDRMLYPARRVETFGPSALVLEPGDAVIRQSADWGQMLMLVDEVDPLPEHNGVTLTLTQWDNSIVGGAPFIAQPTDGDEPDAPLRTLVVSGLLVEPYDIVGDNGSIKPGGRASWTLITDTNVEQVMIRVWPVTGTEDDDSIDFFANGRQQAKIFGPLAPETVYFYKAIPIRRDDRTCTFTTAATFTTGDEVVNVSVEDIQVTQLGQELLNAHGLVVGDDPGSISSLVTALRQREDELALALVDANATNRELLKILSAQRDGANAAIIENQHAIVSESEARAIAITEAVAQFDENLADGFLKFEATANATAGTATITAKVKATAAGNFSEAAWMLKAQASGSTTIRQFGVLGNFYLFKDVLDTGVLLFSVDSSGVAHMKSITFDNVIQSSKKSGSTPYIYLDGNTGFFNFGIA